MENQNNIGGQNIQQIGQNPVNRPMLTSEEPKTKFWMIFITILLITGGVLAFNLRSKATSTKNTIQTPAPTSLLSPTKDGVRTYKSEDGYFAIDLPSEMKMIESKEEKRDDGTTRGEVWFTFGEFNENAPSGLVAVYGKPRIDGKGGSCVDEEGEGAYKTEVVAGQEVSVCEMGGFRAEYFVHPSREIEYWVDTSRLSIEQVGVVSEAVRKTLRFE